MMTFDVLVDRLVEDEIAYVKWSRKLRRGTESGRGMGRLSVKVYLGNDAKKAEEVLKA